MEDTTILILKTLVKENLPLLDVILSRIDCVKSDLQQGNIPEDSIEKYIDLFSELRRLVNNKYVLTEIQILLEHLQLYSSLAAIEEMPVAKYIDAYNTTIATIYDLLSLERYGNSSFILLERKVKNVLKNLTSKIPEEYDPRLDNLLDKLYVMFVSKGIDLGSMQLPFKYL